MYHKLYLLLSILLISQGVRATLSIAPAFGQGMVLQRETSVNIWGRASSLESITVTLDKQSMVISADNNGHWSLKMPTPLAGGPYRLTVQGRDSLIAINEVYVGEVWIAAGQSNMAFRLDKDKDASVTIPQASNTNIRYMMVDLPKANQPLESHYKWRTATTEEVGQMSAIGYYFAQELEAKLAVPVGIICCYKGGTAAEVWMSRATTESNPEHRPIWERYQSKLDSYPIGVYDSLYQKFEADLRDYYKAVKTGNKHVKRPEEPMGIHHYKRPSGLYEQMFLPIVPYTVKGVIWYQGEANAPRAEQYQTLFAATIAQWRRDLDNPQLPFYFVQLSAYDHPAYRPRPIWAELREAQLLTSLQVPNTAMAVSLDYGDKDDIHPTQKRPIGKRLSAIALSQSYGYKIPYTGPLYRSIHINKGRAILCFDHTYNGLKIGGSGSTLLGFTICGEDHHFYPAKAIIRGNKVEVSAPEVSHPVAVRYGWDNWTEANLYNKQGFPASTFRTDSLPLLTHSVR